MTIYNTTTGKNTELSIIDRNTGCEWTADLIGNAGELNYNSEEDRYEMDTDNINWWSNIIDGLEKIEDLKEEAKDLLTDEEFEALEEELSCEGDASDYERHVDVLTAILNKVIAENK